MSLKTKVLVLKRVIAGDQDLIAKAYGQGGILDILVRNGLLNTNEFFSVFEPFNLVEVDLRQRGGVVIPNDVLGVERFSYLSRDYLRYRWMCWVSLFVLKHIRFYDEKLFSLVLKALLADPKGREWALRLRFKLEFLSASGLEPKFLKEDFGNGKLRISLSNGGVSEEGEVEVRASSLRWLVRLKELRSLKGVRIGREEVEEMERLLDLLIEYHIR